MSQYFSNKRYCYKIDFTMHSSARLSYNRDSFNVDVVFGIFFNEVLQVNIALFRSHSGPFQKSLAYFVILIVVVPLFSLICVLACLEFPPVQKVPNMARNKLIDQNSFANFTSSNNFMRTTYNI